MSKKHVNGYLGILMKKKTIIPVALIVLVIIFMAFQTFGSSNKIVVDWNPVADTAKVSTSVQQNVYMENSGSMDGYMCAGSNLKDAVFDYVSDLKQLSDSCGLFYINSREIPYKGDLESYIRDLTPQSFSVAGGDRSNTDLRKMLRSVMSLHRANMVSVFVSDCILDIDHDAQSYFGNCQVSVKNTFEETLKKYPNLGVQIIKLQSKFEGNWYCGKNKETLKGVKRPYYIWIIGDKHILARINREAPCGEILGGIDSYCAFATAGIVPFDMGKKSFIAKPNRPVKVPVFVDLSCSLQDESVLQDVGRYSLEHPGQVRICRITPVTEKRNKYSHVLNLEITNPKTIKSETISFSCPNLPSWVVESNDDTGVDVKKNINKTTGILYLVKGVAEAYKNQLTYGTVSFNMRNK